MTDVVKHFAEIQNYRKIRGLLMLFHFFMWMIYLEIYQVMILKACQSKRASMSKVDFQSCRDLQVF